MHSHSHTDAPASGHHHDNDRPSGHDHGHDAGHHAPCLELPPLPPFECGWLCKLGGYTLFVILPLLLVIFFGGPASKAPDGHAKDPTPHAWLGPNAPEMNDRSGQPLRVALPVPKLQIELHAEDPAQAMQRAEWLVLLQFEQHLTEQFAWHWLSVGVEWLPVADVDDALALLRAGKADLVAAVPAGLLRPEWNLHASAPHLDTGMVSFSELTLVKTAEQTPERVAPVWLSYDPQLAIQAEDYLSRQRLSGRLAQWAEAMLRPLSQTSGEDFAHLTRLSLSRLPPLLDLFQQAAEQSGWEWPFLAAIGYQESHWNQDAVSPTGVRGLMMVTQGAAQQLGQTAASTISQQILLGAAYLRWMAETLPLYGEDLPWLAAAAYNIGPGNLAWLQSVAARRGLDPNRWDDLAALLRGEISNLPAGIRARVQALAPVTEYVARVRLFQQWLATFGQSHLGSVQLTQAPSVTGTEEPLGRLAHPAPDAADAQTEPSSTRAGSTVNTGMAPLAAKGPGLRDPSVAAAQTDRLHWADPAWSAGWWRRGSLDPTLVY